MDIINYFEKVNKNSKDNYKKYSQSNFCLYLVNGQACKILFKDSPYIEKEYYREIYKFSRGAFNLSIKHDVLAFDDLALDLFNNSNNFVIIVDLR